MLLIVFFIGGCGYPSLFNLDLSPDVKFSPQREPEENKSTRSNYGSQYQMQMSRMMFNYMFSVGGIWPWQKEFASGEWTKWKITSDGEQKYTSELASLKQVGDNKKWWRVGAETDEGDTFIYEALLQTDDYSIRRLRSKINEQQAQEVPVSEKTYVYSRPTKLTQESIQAAIVAEETVEVPAGTFDAEHIKYDTPSNSGKINIWMNKNVPGGVVKYRLTETGEGSAFTAELLDHGKGATTKLDSY